MTEGMRQVDDYIDLGDDSEDENDEIDNGKLIAVDENIAFVSNNFDRPSNLKDDMESKEPLDQRYKAGNCNLQNLK